MIPTVYRSYKYTVHTDTGIPFIPAYRTYRYTVHTYDNIPIKNGQIFLFILEKQPGKPAHRIFFTVYTGFSGIRTIVQPIETLAKAGPVTCS